MEINQCKCCGQLPQVDHIAGGGLYVSCCKIEMFGGTDNTIFRWNMNNKPVNPTVEDRRVHAVELAHQVNAVNVAADFNEQFTRA